MRRGAVDRAADRAGLALEVAGRAPDQLDEPVADAEPVDDRRLGGGPVGAVADRGSVDEHEPRLAVLRRARRVRHAGRADVDRGVARGAAVHEDVVELGVVVGGEADQVVRRVAAPAQAEQQREPGERPLAGPRAPDERRASAARGRVRQEPPPDEGLVDGRHDGVGLEHARRRSRRRGRGRRGRRSARPASAGSARRRAPRTAARARAPARRARRADARRRTRARRSRRPRAPPARGAGRRPRRSRSARRSSAAAGRARARARAARSVHHGRTRSASRGSGGRSPAAGRRGGHGGGPVRNASDARHIPAQVPSSRAQSAPAPGDHASSASSARGRSADSSTLEPSANS